MRNGNLWKTYFNTNKSVSSYRTYEEWKLQFPVSTQEFSFMVLTVPMRNGNSSSISSEKRQDFAFLPYLWGMETLYDRLSPMHQIRFLPYLWGMETSLKRVDIVLRERSYRTYEEWKLCDLTNRNTDFEFLPYLWGMETFIQYFFADDVIKVLTVPMRNGNLKFRTL